MRDEGAGVNPFHVRAESMRLAAITQKAEGNKLGELFVARWFVVLHSIICCRSVDEAIGVLREKFKRDPYTLNDTRRKLTATCNFIASTGTLDVVKEDPDDNRILECAEAAHSDYVVPEDKDLLRLALRR